VSLAAGLLLAAAGVAAVAGLGTAAAASCAGMSVQLSPPAGIALQPSHVAISRGGCVRFSNQTATSVTIQVSGGYSRTLPPGTSTGSGTDYVGHTAGTERVTASSTLGTAHGSITVTASSPSPSPSGSRSPSPGPSRSPSPRPSPQPSSSATGPQVAPSPSAGRTRHRRPAPSPSPTPVPTSAVPSVSPSTPAPAVVAGPLEPPSGRGAGLPEAVAALAVVGTGVGLLRVVLAEPVDDAPVVGGSA
jgi:hypothetical protein